MELFVLIFVSIIAFILLIVNILFWRKIKGIQGIVENPDHRATRSLILQKMSKNNDKLGKDIESLLDANEKLGKVARRGFCKMGINRFNALGEKGNGQSFALALLNFKDDGIIVSMLQTSQGARTFIRTIKEGEAEGSPLSQDEKIALERARQVVF